MRAFPDMSGNRREFFHGSLRYGLLGAMAALSAFAWRKAPTTAQRCVNEGICSGCAVFVGCGLPQALSAKAHRRAGL